MGGKLAGSIIAESQFTMFLYIGEVSLFNYMSSLGEQQKQPRVLLNIYVYIYIYNIIYIYNK